MQDGKVASATAFSNVIGEILQWSGQSLEKATESDNEIAMMELEGKMVMKINPINQSIISVESHNDDSSMSSTPVREKKNDSD